MSANPRHAIDLVRRRSLDASAIDPQLAERAERVLVLDSGGLSRLSERTRRAVALIVALRREGLWPPVVPTVVVAESTSGRVGLDANVNRLLKSCDVAEILPEAQARRGGELRARARRGSVVDAVVVAVAEPGSTVITSDRADLEALASHADDVHIEVV